MQQRDLWKEVFPFEIIFLRSMVTNKMLFFVSKLFFVACTMVVLGYVGVLISQSNYVDSDEPLSLIFLLHFEAILILFLPFFCCWFTQVIVSNPDLDHLITFAVQFNSRVKLKFAIIAHLNFICLIGGMGIFFYDDKTTASHIAIVFIITCTYLGPLNCAVSLAVCVIELHRIKIQQFRSVINDKRTCLENRFWNQNFTFSSAGDTESVYDNQEFNKYKGLNSKQLNNATTSVRESSFSIGSPQNEVRELRKQYYQIYALCARSSLSFGLYLLLFLFFGFLYAFVTLYTVYLNQYPPTGYVGFVLVGILTGLGLAAVITTCNETGMKAFKQCGRTKFEKIDKNISFLYSTQ